MQSKIEREQLPKAMLDGQLDVVMTYLEQNKDGLDKAFEPETDGGFELLKAVFNFLIENSSDKCLISNDDEESIDTATKTPSASDGVAMLWSIHQLKSYYKGNHVSQEFVLALATFIVKQNKAGLFAEFWMYNHHLMQLSDDTEQVSLLLDTILFYNNDAGVMPFLLNDFNMTALKNKLAELENSEQTSQLPKSSFEEVKPNYGGESWQITALKEAIEKKEPSPKKNKRSRTPSLFGVSPKITKLRKSDESTENNLLTREGTDGVLTYSNAKYEPVEKIGNTDDLWSTPTNDKPVDTAAVLQFLNELNPGNALDTPSLEGSTSIHDRIFYVPEPNKTEFDNGKGVQQQSLFDFTY